jgi:hypothetical protein
VAEAVPAAEGGWTQQQQQAAAGVRSRRVAHCAE